MSTSTSTSTSTDQTHSSLLGPGYLPNSGNGLDVTRVQVDVLVLEALQNHLQVMRQDGHQVHRVEDAATEALEVRGGHQAQQVLQGEESDAEALHVLAVESPAGLTGRGLTRDSEGQMVVQ